MTLLLPLDELLAVTCEFQLHGAASLTPAVARFERGRYRAAKAPAVTRGQDADQGLQGLRVGPSPHGRHSKRATKLKYLPPMADEHRRRCLFVALSATLRACFDRATLWVVHRDPPGRTGASPGPAQGLSHQNHPTVERQRQGQNRQERLWTPVAAPGGANPGEGVSNSPTVGLAAGPRGLPVNTSPINFARPEASNIASCPPEALPPLFGIIVRCPGYLSRT